MLDNNLLWLIDWYAHQYGNNLPHQVGIKIKNIDNPGWSITINIQDIDLKDKEFQEIRVDRTENDWFFCKIENGFFQVYCGTFNFDEALQTFRDWVEKKHTLIENFKLDDSLFWIVNWYDSQCDGDWEHSSGIKIETIVNTNWNVVINIEETELEDKHFEDISIKRTENDWFNCRVENGSFRGNCSTFNLIELLQMFRSWAQS